MARRPLERRCIVTQRARVSGGASPPHRLLRVQAPELFREDVPLNVIQRQLGHRNLGVTSVYLQGINPDEIIETVHARRPPMIPASAGLLLPPAG